MQHMEHSNRNIISETGRIRNIIWEVEPWRIDIRRPISYA